MTTLEEDAETKKQIEKEKRVLDETKRLTEVFKKIPLQSKKAVKSLISNAAFMTVTLEDLQDEINKVGTISRYQNGANQWGTKKSPEIEVYNSLIKNHSSIIKQLSDLLPAEVSLKKEDDGFNSFVSIKND